MQDEDTLIFVEVRFRADNRFGGAAATVDHRKQKRLIAAAQVFLQNEAALPRCRFDVVAIDGAGGIDWIKGAFDAS